MSKEPQQTSKSIRILFFGSFQDYSVSVLSALVRHFTVTSVVTTPPMPQGRHMTLTHTPVYDWALTHGLPVYPLDSLDIIPASIQVPDFIVTAGYGKLIPPHWLSLPKIMAVNLHPSLLPNYRGRFPAEWAILRGETETGVTLVQMTQEFDKGKILVQTSYPLKPTDTKETVYAALFTLGTDLIVTHLPKIFQGQIHPQVQPQGSFFYARNLTREDGYIPWDECKKMILENSDELDRKIRALSNWPGVWTMVPVLGNRKQETGRKEIRLKILKRVKNPVGNFVYMVQPEGKKPMSFDIFQKNSLL